MEDNPSDQNSRWSSESNVSPQFLILKLYLVLNCIDKDDLTIDYHLLEF